MTVVLRGAFTPGIAVFLTVLAVLAVAVLLYLVPEIKKYATVNKLNESGVRDRRFVSELLSVYFKSNVIEAPYLLRTDKDCSPRADVIVVCEGGVIVLSVEDRAGYFDTPRSGDWTLKNDDGVTRVANPFESGMYYVGACSNIAKRNAISCPIYNLVLLSNDEVEYSGTSGDGVLTNDVIVSCIKKIKEKHKISTPEVQTLTRLIKQNSIYCKKLFTNDRIDDDFDDSFADKKEPEPVIQSVFVSGDDEDENKSDVKENDDLDISW